MNGFTIGQLAKKVGVNIETVRFYERKGLLPPPKRRESGYRVYGEEDVRRLQFIRHAKELGFSLKEIQELLELRVDPNTTCDDVRRKAEQKIADIERRIQELQRVRKALQSLAAACIGHGPEGDCPFLEALEAVEDDT